MRVTFRAGLFSFAFALLAACQGSGVSEISSLANEDGLLPDRVTLVSWNTQKLRDPEVARDLSDIIGRHKPDLVFLQEVKINRLQLDDMGGHFAEGWSYPWPGGPTVGVLTLSNSSPVNVQPVQTGWRELFVTAPKVSLITEHPLPNGQTLLAVNVHLLNFESWEPFMLRAQLRDLEFRMALHEGPIIMAGDFNTWSEARLALVDGLAGRLQLREVTGFPDGRKTGDLDSALLHWVFGVHPELPLDRVYSRGFSALSAEVLPSDASDHRPVLVTLALDPVWDAKQEAPSLPNCWEPPRITNARNYRSIC